jgi:hypothetical protein
MTERYAGLGSAAAFTAALEKALQDALEQTKAKIGEHFTSSVTAFTLEAHNRFVDGAFAQSSTIEVVLGDGRTGSWTTAGGFLDLLAYIEQDLAGREPGR